MLISEKERIFYDFVTFKNPYPLIESEFDSNFPTSDESCDFNLILKRSHLISILKRYISEEITTKELYMWAETLYRRYQNFQSEPGFADIVFTTLEDIQREYDIDPSRLGKEFAQDLIRDLQTAIYDPKDVD